MIIAEQVALVTGANRGLGKQLAQELLTRGAKVYAGARNPAEIDLPGAVSLQLDITDSSLIASAAMVAWDITVLINNAGSDTDASFLTGEIEDVRRVFDTHVFGTLATIRAFAPLIEMNGGGTILNILSVLSWIGNEKHGPYSSAKSAEWSLTNSLRLSLAPKKIKVAGLHVGYMDTDMVANIQAPKSDPKDIARIAIEGIEAGSYEILADELSRKVQQGLAGGVAVLYPKLFE